MPNDTATTQEEVYVTVEQLAAYHASIKDGLASAIGPVNVSVMVTGWIGENAPFTQEIAVAGVTAGMNNLSLNPINVINDKEREAYYKAIGCLLPGAESGDGKITLKAYTKPEIDFIMVLKGVEV